VSYTIEQLDAACQPYRARIRALEIENNRLARISLAARALLKYIDDHDWGHIPEGVTADTLRDLLTASETICECVPLDARGTPGDLEIYCPKCGKIFRGSETDQMCIHGVHVREKCAQCETGVKP
jgi:hypothetical protein